LKSKTATEQSASEWSTAGMIAPGKAREEWLKRRCLALAGHDPERSLNNFATSETIDTSALTGAAVRECGLSLLGIDRGVEVTRGRTTDDRR
jgi:hypothetical protein